MIKNRLGIQLNLQLKEFYSSYCFLQLIGKMDNGMVIYFDKISYGRNINECIMENHIDREAVKKCGADLEEHNLFEIGSGEINGNDNYLVCFDNESGKVLLICFAEQQVQYLNMTLHEMLNSFVEVF